MTSDDEGRAVRPWRAYSEGLASVICARVAGGEPLMAVCREPDMPSRAGVKGWAKARPAFRARLAAAMAAGRHGPRGGRRAVYCRHMARLICERVAAGMTVGQACDLPGLPCEDTVYNWVKRYPEFREAYGLARSVQAHRRFDQVWEIAEAATAETAFLAKVRIEAARWQAARLAPTKYGERLERAKDGEGDGRPQLNVIIRRFADDVKIEAAERAAAGLAQDGAEDGAAIWPGPR